MQRLIAVVTFALLLALAPAAAARPTPSFTATPGADQTVAFDASASVCEFGPCGYSWTWDNGTRLGVAMGKGVRITYRFPVGGPQTVVLKMSDRCAAGSATFCPATTSRQVLVTAAPGTARPPASTSPPPAAAPTADAMPGQTIGVTIARAKVCRTPGRGVIRSILLGTRFRVDRVYRVAHGRSRGLWLHGTATFTGASGRPVKVSGWVKASAFA